MMKFFNWGLAIAGATLASVVTTTVPAAAVTVTVDGTEYDVTTTRGTFNALEQTLNSQPWWGDSTLAQSLATELGGQLGYPNSDGVASPLFAFAIFAPGASVWFLNNSVSCELSECLYRAFVGTNESFDYAITPTPAPLESDGWAILISTTALGLGVKLKQLKNKKKIDIRRIV